MGPRALDPAQKYRKVGLGSFRKMILWGWRSRQKDSGSHRAWEEMGIVYGTESTVEQERQGFRN